MIGYYLTGLLAVEKHTPLWSILNLHFFAVQQHAVDFHDSFLGSFLSLKMHKSVSFGAFFVTCNLCSQGEEKWTTDC